MSSVHPEPPAKDPPTPHSTPLRGRSRPPLVAQHSVVRKTMTSTSKLFPQESCTTVAVGGDTYTIVASRKSSGQKVGSNNVPLNTKNVEDSTNQKPPPFVTTDNGETIRIFRRTRSGRPHSASRADSVAIMSSSPLTASEILDSPGGMSALGQSLGATEVDEASFMQIGLIQGDSQTESEDEILKTEELPAPDTPAGIREAFLKLKQLLSKMKDSAIDPETLISNLEYVTEVVQAVAAKADALTEEDLRDENEDDLSELQSEAVPDEVRKWLASTFAKQEQVTRRSEERPSFRSVANAIRTGIFIERIYRRMSSSQLMIIPPEVQKALKLSNEWTFDIFSLAVNCKGSPLRFMGYELLSRHGCLHKYKIPPSVLETMLVHVELGYASNGNHYHNHLHACDVLQTTHYFISETGIANWMSDLEVFTSLMAAIIHDFDHSGTTNNFHINAGSNLALLYNDRAVLENHHVSAFFRLIQENNCNIFANMQKADFREFRNLIIEMVLHTDMTQHFSQLKAMKTILQAHTGEPSFDKTKVLCLLLHSCDVSHPAKRWDVHWQWTARCIEEFFDQGDREAELGLEYSPLCDRHNTMVPQSQIGFIDFIVSPTLNVLGDVLETILRGMEQANKKPGNRDDSTEQQLEKAPLLKRPWMDILAVNKEKWQAKHDAGEQGIEPSGALRDLRPQSVTSITGKSRPCSAVSSNNPQSRMSDHAEETEGHDELHIQEIDGEDEPDDSQDNLEPYQRRGPISINNNKILLESSPPNRDTNLQDVIDDIPSHVISRTGTPANWDFDDRECSLKSSPPRPDSAEIHCTPPPLRNVPISVDHHLRK
ncbi:dual specificity calcium/calmodulin-dependent 3',5'-cyclic nucleotide phosphodiesterase 1B-like isoform X3 [Tigriopus californicus]|uniref:dual specificity calcium/calmodulin-dependent 3',5'-cyclic nucleotide phosphodiesterase 1B-like isoform X3 n=1 Tax=Tigriopus californicus TaxID=6832 RepID=UPI0027DA3B18|nr:dual specificity calcium/calmodulin-dependent 3',5'-cyclic nucleotide phosphodiesterase 1B-like isoform X3 [Tigriopus californicus]